MGPLRRSFLYAGHKECECSDTSGGGSENVLTNVQARKGWRGWGKLGARVPISVLTAGGPLPGPWIRRGGATTFHLGGTNLYSDVLWSYPMVGPASVLDLPDHNETWLQA